ncbi:22380_t:CDS:2, partial [Cetraspora pellucida]
VQSINTPGGSVAVGATITITWSYTTQANPLPGTLSVIENTTKNTVIISSTITLSTQSYQWTVNVPAGTYYLALNDGSGDKYSGTQGAPKSASTPTPTPTASAAASFTESSISGYKLLFSLIVVAAVMVTGYFEKRRGKLSEKLQEGNVEVGELPEEDVDDFSERISADKPIIDLESDYLDVGFQEADHRIRDKFATYFQEKDRVEAFSVDIFMSVLSKIEKKMDRNFSALQKDLEEGELLDEAWPDIKLSKPCDQYEYDFLAKVGKCLDRAIKGLLIPARKKFIGIREKIETHAVTLRLADSKGWRTALQIVKIKYSSKSKNNQKRGKDYLLPTLSDSEENELYKKDKRKKFIPLVVEENTVGTKLLEMQNRTFQVVMNWLANGVPLFSKGILVLAAQQVSGQYSLSVEQNK